jgi:hypothetical protein
MQILILPSIAILSAALFAFLANGFAPREANPPTVVEAFAPREANPPTVVETFAPREANPPTVVEAFAPRGATTNNYNFTFYKQIN